MNKRKLVLVLLLATFILGLVNFNIPTVKAGDLSAYGVEWVADDTRFQPTTYPESYYVECVNTTFFVYMKNVSGTYKFYIKSFNHTTDTMSSETFIGNSISTDAHNAPAISNLPNGSLIIFFDTHSYVPGYISYRVSNGAWNINSWFSTQTETGDFTYPNPCSFDDKLVLIIRESQPDMASVIWYRYDFNNTHFWQNKTQITYYYGDEGTGGLYAVFNKIGSNILMSAHLCNASTPADLNLYYACSQDKGVSWKKADGSALALPLGENAKVLDVPDQTVYTFPNFNHDGNPCISYTRRDSTPAPYTDYHWLGLAFWNGVAWQYNNLTNQNMQLLNFSYTQDASGWFGVCVYPFLDPAFQRLTFWAPSVGDEMLSRYVQSAENPYVFVQVLKTDVNATGGGKFLGVRDALVPYEGFVSCITDAGVQTAYFVYNRASYLYTFKGKYDEDTGDLYSVGTRTVNITAYFTNQEPERFELNGTYWYGSAYQPLYFLMNTSVNRQYWTSEGENEETIKVYDCDLTAYTISFLDLAGVLDEYPIVTASRYIGGNLTVVEKRKVDIESKVVMALKNGEKYTIQIMDGSTWTFGDLAMTNIVTIQLTLKGIAFPKETLMTSKYVRIYGLRVFDTPNGTITITYQDTLNMTNSVDIYINYKNGTNVYHAQETSDSFNHEWSNAVNDTDYAVVCTIDHERYGVYTWKNYYPREGFSSMPFGLDFLGSLPFATAYIIPAFFIVFAGGCFSAINKELGAFSMVVVAVLLAYMGWIPISGATLMVAFALVVLMGLVAAKRRVET